MCSHDRCLTVKCTAPSLYEVLPRKVDIVSSEDTYAASLQQLVAGMQATLFLPVCMQVFLTGMQQVVLCLTCDSTLSGTFLLGLDTAEGHCRSHPQDSISPHQ